jgi:hypothetical protein
MSRKWFSILALIAAATFFLSLSSCSFNSHLESIQVQPTSGTFGAADPSLFFNFKAFGTYTHPPRTVDITGQVDWQSDNPEVVQVTSAGVVSPSTDLGCGLANIFATLQDGNNDVVSNTAAVTVDGPASSGCTPAGIPPTLTVNFSGTATGTVVSTPAGIDCSSPSSCNAEFTQGSTVTLTGTPTGTSTSVTWNGCNTVTGFNCSVVMENSVAVTATFQ